MYEKIIAISIDDNEQNLMLLEAFADQIDLPIKSFIDPVEAFDFISNNDVDIIKFSKEKYRDQGCKNDNQPTHSRCTFFLYLPF